MNVRRYTTIVVDDLGQEYDKGENAHIPKDRLAANAFVRLISEKDDPQHQPNDESA